MGLIGKTVGFVASHGGSHFVNGVSGVVGAAAQAPNAIGFIALITLVARAVEQKIRENCQQAPTSPSSSTKASPAPTPAADSFFTRTKNAYYALNKTDLAMIAGGSLVLGFLTTIEIHRFLPSMTANANWIAKYFSLQFQPVCLESAKRILKRVPLINR